MKKRWMLAVAALVLVAAFAGAAGAEEGASAGETMDITWQFRYETSWCLEELNRMFNVNIISNGLWNNDSEAMDLMFASGDIPEVFTRGDVMEHYQEGLTRSIPNDMIRKHAPNYTANLDNYPWAWLYHQNPDNPDEQIGIVGISLTSTWPFFFPAFRVDWAEKVGFDLPGYEENKRSLEDMGRVFFFDEARDLEWFEDLMIAFRDGDPDGNGKMDTIPLAGCNNRMRAFGGLVGAFGIDTWNLGVGRQGTANHIENGELTITAVSKNYRSFLQTLAKWYELGLLDREFPTLNTTKMWEKISNHQIGVSFAAGQSDIGVRPQRAPGAFVSDEELGSGAEAVVMQPPIGPGGFQGTPVYKSILPVSGSSLRMRHDVSDAKARKILEIYDYYNCTEEGWLKKQYGKEGIHYTWSGEPFNSKPVAVNPADVPEGYPEYGKFVTYPAMYMEYQFKYIYPKKSADWVSDYLLKDGFRFGLRPQRWDQFYTTDLEEIYLQYGEGMNTLFDEYYYKAITGVLNLDEDWDEYVSEYNKNGGDLYLEALKKAPIVAELLKGNIVY
jgi:hypothetical protein